MERRHDPSGDRVSSSCLSFYHLLAVRIRDMVCNPAALILRAGVLYACYEYVCVNSYVSYVPPPAELGELAVSAESAELG